MSKKRIDVNFMVKYNHLRDDVRVPDGVDIIFTDLDAVDEEGIFGQSGRKFAQAGFIFEFKRSYAEKFVEKLKIARYTVPEDYEGIINDMPAYITINGVPYKKENDN